MGEMAGEDLSNKQQAASRKTLKQAGTPTDGFFSRAATSRKQQNAS
jgi:uncharacterized membrane protein